MEISEGDELVGPFMVAEFEALASRALSIEQSRSSRINYYIVSVTAAIGILSIIFQMQSAEYPMIALVISGVIFLLGIATLSEYVELASQAVFLYRRAGRIRCWFHDKNPSILPYLAWTPGDDTPPFKDAPGHATFAGKDSILWLGNSLSGSIVVFVGLSISGLLPRAASIGAAAVAFVLMWFLQNRYLESLMRNYERIGSEGGRVHFERAQRTYVSPRVIGR